MHTARAGELFAEASLFSARYHCDAVAIQDSEVLLYAKKELVQRLRADGDAMWEFAAQMAGRLHSLRTQRELRQIRSAPERVLQSLRLRCDDTGGWTPDGTLKHFAQDIGLTHEALYRALARLEREGHIDRVDNKIFLASSKGSKVARGKQGDAR
jgi:CRP-like cAMP-binding protein